MDAKAKAIMTRPRTRNEGANLPPFCSLLSLTWFDM
jgi:hypothetical protein